MSVQDPVKIRRRRDAYLRAESLDLTSCNEQYIVAKHGVAANLYVRP